MNNMITATTTALNYAGFDETDVTTLNAVLAGGYFVVTFETEYMGYEIWVDGNGTDVLGIDTVPVELSIEPEELPVTPTEAQAAANRYANLLIVRIIAYFIAVKRVFSAA